MSSKTESSQLSEEQLKQNCKNLKAKILQVEESNKLAALSISRTKIAVNRLRLEYSILLERLENKAIINDDSDLSDLSDIEISDKKLTKKRRNVVGNNQVRDPNQPKRPLNPYLVFCDLEKEKFKRDAEAEGKTIDLSKTLGEAWKNLGQDGRQPYINIYNEDKERYQKEMAIYESNNNKRQKTNNGKSITDTNESSINPESKQDLPVDDAEQLEEQNGEVEESIDTKEETLETEEQTEPDVKIETTTE